MNQWMNDADSFPSFLPMLFLQLFYRGPAVGEPVPVLNAGKKQHADHQWVNSGKRATIHSNGTFRMLD